MATSIELFNRIRKIQDQMDKYPQNAADRAEKLFTMSGQIEAMQDQLAEALAAEKGARVTSTGKLVSGSDPQGITAQALGIKSEFTGIKPGFRAAITVPAGPAVVDPTVPRFADLPRTFADSLQQSSTEAGVTYLRRGAKVNAAAQWSDGSAKPESSYVWTEHSAPLTWIAHHAPISKTQASDWSMLDTTVRGELLAGLAQAKSRAVLTGANPSGITGITNTVGLQTHTIASGDNAYDAIRRMATAVYVNSGFAPTHVCVSPLVDETLDLLQDDQKAYLKVKQGGRVWNLEVVIDAGLAVHDSAEGLTHHGMIVYSALGAAVLTKEQDNVEIGLVDDQFVHNAYTLLAEGRYALQVRFPDAFCYCEDAIPAVTDASS